MQQKKQPLISVCVPVFNTEHYLFKCLESILTQDFDNFEVIVVSDCSKGKDQKGHNAKKIVKIAQKTTDVPITFVEHSQNRGILEVRRTAFIASSGKYITYLDSDDFLVPGALKALYNAAITNNADIVHGTSTGGKFAEDGTFIPSKENRYGQIYYGTVENPNILSEWLLGKKYTANVWGKLILHDVYTLAFNQIPYTTCNLAEDYLLFFFIAFYAKKYVGIKENVYLYREEGGMSSMPKIDTLHKWELICSSASVFSIIATWLEENKTQNGEYIINTDVLDSVKIATQYYLLNNLMSFNCAVDDAIKPEAYQMLCDFWGEDFVKYTEQKMQESHAASHGTSQDCHAASHCHCECNEAI